MGVHPVDCSLCLGGVSRSRFCLLETAHKTVVTSHCCGHARLCRRCSQWPIASRPHSTGRSAIPMVGAGDGGMKLPVSGVVRQLGGCLLRGCASHDLNEDVECGCYIQSLHIFLAFLTHSACCNHFFVGIVGSCRNCQRKEGRGCGKL